MSIPQNKSLIFSLTLAAALLFGDFTSSHAATLINNSFESQTGFVGGQIPYTDSTSITGWFIQGVGNGDVNGFSQLQGVDNGAVLGKDGNNFSYNVRGVLQTLDSTRPTILSGETYTLSFLAEADFGNVATRNSVSIDWYSGVSGYTPLSSTTQIFTITENNIFLTYSFNGIAPVGATHLGVRFDSTLAAVGGDGGNAFIDNVTVVPEPSTYVYMLSGVVLLYILNRKKSVAV